MTIVMLGGEGNMKPVINDMKEKLISPQIRPFSMMLTSIGRLNSAERSNKTSALERENIRRAKSFLLFSCDCATRRESHKYGRVTLNSQTIWLAIIWKDDQGEIKGTSHRKRLSNSKGEKMSAEQEQIHLWHSSCWKGR